MIRSLPVEKVFAEKKVKKTINIIEKPQRRLTGVILRTRRVCFRNAKNNEWQYCELCGRFRFRIHRVAWSKLLILLRTQVLIYARAPSPETRSAHFLLIISVSEN